MLGIQKKLTNSFYAILSLPATAMGFALSVQISALSWILKNKYGLEIEDIGFVWAAGPLAGILGQVLIGVISDNVWFWNGRRRPFIIIGGTLAALMLLALPSIDIISTSLGFDEILGVALVVAIMLDLAINVSFNPTRSVIADVTPEGEKRTKGYTWMQTVSGTFGVLAYAIGALWDNYVLIYFGAFLVLATSVIPPFFIEEPRNNVLSETGSSSKLSVGKILLIIQPLWGFLIYDIYAMVIKIGKFEVDHYYVEYICLGLSVIFVGNALLKKEGNEKSIGTDIGGFKKVLAAHSFSWIGVQSMFIYTLFYVEDKLPDLNETEAGRVVSWSFLILNAVAAVLPSTVLEPLARSYGRVKTHLVSIGIMALGYAGIVFFGKSELTIYIFMGIAGIGWGAIVSLPFAIMSQKVDKGKMGLYMGLFNLSVVLPQLIASLGIAKLIDSFEDKSLIFIVCAVCLLISTVAWGFVKEQKEEGQST
ncbi:MAG: MFS transporter [Bacteroidota bacterium]